MTSLASIESKKRSLKQRVQLFLSEEKRQMEERIRTFTEQEHSRFAATQLQISRNEESIYQILDNIASKLKTDQNLDQNLAKQLNIVENVAVDKDLVLNTGYLGLNSTINTNANPKQQLFGDNEQTTKKSQPIRYRSQSVDYESSAGNVGGIFDIDLDDGHAFDSISYSDDEEEDVDNEESIDNTNNDFNKRYNIGRTVPNAQINAQTNRQVAYSLPIQVPKWKTHHNHNDAIDEDEVPMIPNGETIAESIQKLAKSVRNESDIFGDRPRRRTNTFGDLIKSRPL